MKCRMDLQTDGPDSRGWRKWKCSRSGCAQKTDWTPDVGDRIHFQCVGLPAAHEWGHWLSLILGAFFITTDSWLWIKARLGLKLQCGCEARKNWLNRLGANWFKP